MPAFESTKPMSLKNLIHVSPLACMGMFLLGGVFSAQFGMSAGWGTQAGLSVPQISLFVTVIYVGGLVLQYPIGWISDRMDRRQLVLILSLAAGVGGLLGAVAGGVFALDLVAGFIVGGLSNPLYALLLAYANDYMAREDMPAASAGFLFINGVGAIFGPLITGWLMEAVGSWGYFLFIAVLMFALGGYTAWRMKRRKRRGRIGEGGFVAVTPSASQVAVEAAQEVSLDRQDER
jgi:MFS family permease